MSDILEQMTAAQTNHDAMRWGWIAEWADEIKRLRARVLDLENSLRMSRAEATAQADGALSLLAAGYAESEENKKLRARVAELEAAQEWEARLREALEKIEGGHVDGASVFAITNSWKAFGTELQKIARAALAKASS